MMRSPIAPSATATATSSRSAPSQSRRTEGLEEAVSSSGKFREAPRHFLINAAAERHDEIGDAVQPFPAPGIEFGRLAVARRQRVDVALVPGETQREPFLPLAAELAEAVRRSVIARKLVSQPAGFAEIVGLCHAGLFPEFAQRRGTQILAFVDAALRHLPLKAGKDDLRSIVLEAPSNKNLTSRVEESDAHIWAVGFIVGHTASPDAGAYMSYSAELGAITLRRDRAAILLDFQRCNSPGSSHQPPARAENS